MWKYNIFIPPGLFYLKFYDVSVKSINCVCARTNKQLILLDTHIILFFNSKNFTLYIKIPHLRFPANEGFLLLYSILTVIHRLIRITVQIQVKQLS